MFNIRTAFNTDLDAITAMFRSQLAESPRVSRLDFDEDKFRAAVMNLMDQDDGYVRIMLNDKQEPVGMAMAYAQSEWYSSTKLAQGLTVYVVPEYRGEGLSKHLIACADRWAEDQGVLWFQAGTMMGIGEDAARRAYESNGFKVCGLGFDKWYR